MFKTSSNFLTDCSKAVLCLWIPFCYLFHICLCHTVLYVPCSLVFICWERSALLSVRFSFVFVNYPYDVLGQVWYMTVSIPDHCLLPYFYCSKLKPLFHFLNECVHIQHKYIKFGEFCQFVLKVLSRNEIDISQGP